MEILFLIECARNFNRVQQQTMMGFFRICVKCSHRRNLSTQPTMTSFSVRSFMNWALEFVVSEPILGRRNSGSRLDHLLHALLLYIPQRHQTYPDHRWLVQEELSGNAARKTMICNHYSLKILWTFCFTSRSILAD